MLKKFASVDRVALSKSLLVTLTYPRSFPTDTSTSRRTSTRFPSVWRGLSDFVRDLKLEYQQRAPTLSLGSDGVPFLARQWLSRAWYQIVGSDDPRHLRAGTQVQRCKSTRKALSYAAKYVAKISTCAPVQHVGRFWGIVGRRHLHSVVQWPLDRGGHARLSRVIRNLVGSRSKPTASARHGIGWCFADGRAGVRAVLYAAGMTWEPTAA